MNFVYVSSPILQLSGKERTGDMNKDFVIYIHAEGMNDKAWKIPYTFKFDFKELKRMRKFGNKDYINPEVFKRFLKNYLIVENLDEVTTTLYMKRKSFVAKLLGFIRREK